MMVHADVFFHITTGENATAERNPERFPLERRIKRGPLSHVSHILPEKSSYGSDFMRLACLSTRDQLKLGWKLKWLK